MTSDLFDLPPAVPAQAIRTGLATAPTNSPTTTETPAPPIKKSKGRVKKTFRVYDGDQSRLVTVIGRDAWMLQILVGAGVKGATALENPAPRISHYIWKLRHTYGISIASVEEEHGGAYAGHHARYTLHQRVELADQGGAA